MGLSRVNNCFESYTYDYAGRLTSTTDAYGNTSYITYDALGRKSSESDKMGNFVYYTYDDLGRVIKIDSPFNSVTRSEKRMYYDANGNLIKEMQSNNADNTADLTFDTVEYAYDCMNKLTDVITHVSPTEKTYVHYEYDIAGQMTKMVTGLSEPYTEGSTAGKVTEYAYDLDGNCISVTDPLDMTETYTYNYNRMLLSATDRNGVRSVFTYDALGKPLTEKYYLDNELVKTTTNSYDDAGRLTQISETGAITVSYTYDSRGRLSTEAQGSNILQHIYDDRENLIQSKLLVNGLYDVWITNYNYDTNGRLVGVNNTNMPTAQQSTAFTYDANGNLLTETTGDLVTSYTYNNAGLITQKTHSVNGADPTAVFVSPSNYFTYSYYTNGNQKSAFDSVSIFLPSYTYDGAGRLTEEVHEGSGIDEAFSYTYDASGNRLTKVSEYNPNEWYGAKTTETEVYTYDANNRLTSVTVGENIVNYTYDNNGNLLSESNGKTYSYNVLNQLVGYSDGTNSATYSYYATGLRSTKNVYSNSDSRRYVWNGNDLIYENGINRAANLGKYYNYGYGLISSQDNKSGKSLLYEKDGHGNIVMTVGSGYNYNSSQRYDAFGICNSYLYPDGDPMRYCGEYQDYESGLLYLRARYYSPAIGRFINEDPHWNVENMIYGDEPESGDENQPVKPNYSSIVQSSNLYPYCANNPVKLVDPSGEIFIELLAVGIIAVGSLILTSCGGGNRAYENGRPASPITMGDASSLPSNALYSYQQYSNSGWGGNYSGQTPGTHANGSWGNTNGSLPSFDVYGVAITYKEFDVNNYNGVSRDAERFIVGSDGSVYYTNDHYNTFVKIE